MTVEPAPTVVVGVGQAGINVINRLHNGDGLGWGDEYEKYFQYIAVDSSANEVRNAPEKATEVYLQSPRRHTEVDQRVYPYLSTNLDIGEKGAKRQRPVGRYKLDNTETPSWDNHFEKVSDAIEGHMRRSRQDPDINSQQLNVIHIHSLGGGTGSGTFPLFAQMLNKITDALEGTAGGMDIYTAGIGVVPEIIHNLDTLNPPGDNRYYANAYASLKDLEHLIDASSEDSLPVYLYSKIADTHEDLRSFNIDELDPTYEIDSSPYRHYFLIGVDEDQIEGDNKMRGPETYRAMVNNTIVSAVYGLAMYGNEIENWFETAEGKAQFGSFGQTQLSIPIEAVRDYCSIQEEINTLEEQIGAGDTEGDGELVEERREKQRQRDALQAILDDPRNILKEFDNSEEVRSTVKEQVQRHIPSGNNVIETTSDDLDAILENLTERYGDRIIALAMELAEDRLESEGKGIRDSWRDVVNSKYKDLEVASEDGFGHNVRTTSEKAGELRRFLNDKIDELERSISDEEEDDGGGLFGLDLDLGGGPEYREWLEAYRAHKEDLLEYQRNRDQLESLKDEVRSRRGEVLQETIKPRIERLNDEIETLRRRINEAENQLRELREDKDDKIGDLTDAEYGERIGRLALDEQKVREDLDQQTLESDLTSLAAFAESGYLARDLGNRIEGRIGQSFAWESALMTWSDSSDVENIGNRSSAVREIWMLYNDANAGLPEFNITGAGRHEFRRTVGAEDSVFPQFEDPYTIQFVTYCLDSPLTDLRVYADLDEAATEGWLDAIIDVWRDHRLAFAYPEWYGPEIQRVHDIEKSVELPELPELNIFKIDTDREGGELKNWVSSHGLASYLWNGDEWDKYDEYITVSGFDHVGWKYYLREEFSLEYDDMRAIVPSGRTTHLWLAGEITWEDVLTEIEENLIDEYHVEISLASGES